MSDLRLEDLVALNPNIEGDYYPVTRVKVLEALGAWKLWLCWGNDPEDSCDQCGPFEVVHRG